MSTRKTTTIIQEVLADGSAQQRKNAATALAALARDESDRLLVAVAVGDPDENVRRHAINEILSGSAAREQREGLLSALRAAQGTEDEQRKAYAIFGQLRAAGVPVGRPSFRETLRHLRLVASLPGLPDPGTPPFNWYFLGWAGVGSLVAVFVLLLYATFGLGWQFKEAVFPSLFILSPLFGAVLGLFAAQRAVPINFHYDQLAGGTVELIRVGGWTLFPGFLMGLILSAAADANGTAVLALWAGGMLSCSVIAAAVRLGTIVTFGAGARASISRGTQILTGTVFGVGALIALCEFWLGTSFTVDDDARVALYAAWLLMLPTTVSLATVFSRTDHRCSPRSRRGTWLPTLMAALVLSLSGIFMWKTFHSHFVALGPSLQELGAAPKVRSRTEQLAVTSLPASWSFAADFPQEVSVDVGQQEESSTGLVVQVDDASVIGRSPRTGISRFRVLEPGRYRVHVTAGVASELSVDKVYPQLRRLAVANDAEPPNVTSRTIALILNSGFEPTRTLQESEVAKDTDAPVTSVQWSLQSLPAERVLELSRESQVRASLLEFSDLDTVLTLLGSKDETLEVGDDPPEVAAWLPAGRYVLKVARGIGKDRIDLKTPRDLRATFISPERRALQPDEIAQIGQESLATFSWKLTALPAIIKYELNRTTNVHVWLIDPPDLELILELYKDGQLTRSYDGPAIEQILASGSYQIRVDLPKYMREGGEPRQLGLDEPLVARLDLDAESVPLLDERIPRPAPPPPAKPRRP